MSTTKKTKKEEEIIALIKMLPEQDQVLVFELIKRLVLAWDPDFTKVTAEDADDIEEARAEYARGECVSLEDIMKST